MIRAELAHLKTEAKDLQRFGWLVGGIFTILGLWFYWRGKWFYPYLLAPGVPLLILGTVRPALLRRVYIAWMTMALLLGVAVSTILLTLFFYFVVTPIGLTARLFGKDFLNRKLERQTSTYWMTRRMAAPTSKKNYEQQF